MENNGWSVDEYRSKAERYCAGAERCAWQVRTKLQQWECPEMEMDSIIRHLYKNAYLDDLRFARAYVHDKVLYQGWGRRKIEVMLASLHLTEDAIHTALSEIDDSEYYRILRKAAGQKKGTTRDSLVRFLMQRGFLYSEIKQVIGDKL